MLRALHESRRWRHAHAVAAAPRASPSVRRRHVPQSVAAKAELEQIMMVPRNIVSPQSNKPVMGIVQDSLLASARMTSRDTFIEQDLLFNLLMWVGDDWDGVIPPPAILKPRPLWTGKQVFSLIIPKLNFKGKGNRFPKKGADTLNWSDGTVLIHQGKLLTGVMDKKILGTSGGSLIHVTWLEKGSEATMYLINRVQTLTNNWLVTVSFSIGIGDAVADQSTMRNIESIIDEAKDKVKQLVQRGQRGELECQPGRTMIESFEAMVNRVLNAARTSAGLSVQDSISEANNVKSMAMAGSKGNDINISQIIACVGQQNVEGKRIPYGFRRRTLPHFAKDDLGPESRGFVENSYLRGLSPQEFFFHAMGGREGLIDTACKTAQTGYLQRRLVKSMESTAVQYDGTVRTNQGHVVQFLYGEDGGDGAWVEKQKFPSLLLGDDQLRKAYSINLSEGRDKQGPVTQGVALDVDVAAACRADPDLETLLEAELDRLKGDRDALRAIFACREPDRDADPFAQLPVNLERLVWAAQKQFECGERLDTAVLDPRVVLEGVTRLCVRIRTCRRDVGETNEQSPEATAAAAAEADDATQLFVILVRSTLAARKVVFEHRLNRAAFDWLVGEVEARFVQARAHAGEMCGVLAAQSMGEPATQMTLNTFHFAGVSAKNVTLGVPRLNEILNVAKTVRTPSLTIYLADEWKEDEAKARGVQAKLEHTTLGDVTVKTQIVYDPDATDSVVAEDREFVQAYCEVPDEDFDAKAMSPWVLRFVLNREVVADKKLRMADVAATVADEYGADLHCIYADDNADQLVLRVRIRTGGDQPQDDDDDDEWQLLRRVEQSMLADLRLRGIPRVTKVYIKKQKTNIWTSNGALGNGEEWVLETDGTNLATVLADPDVDCTRTVSNDIVEICSVMGIEGTRQALLQMLREVISFDGAYVNYRHLAVLCDTMCFRGSLMAISRHGINRGDSGPLLSASFEETVEVLFKSAIFARKDDVDGVTPNIMLGQLAHVGTGVSDLLLDSAQLEHAVELEAPDQQQNASLREWGDASPDAVPGQAPAMTPYASSPAGLYGASPARGGATPGWGDAAFSPTVGGISSVLSPVHGASPIYGASPAYGGVASPVYGGGVASPAYSCVPASRFSSRLSFVRADCHTSRGSGPSPFVSLAGLHHPLTVPSGRLESTNNLGPIP